MSFGLFEEGKIKEEYGFFPTYQEATKQAFNENYGKEKTRKPLLKVGEITPLKEWTVKECEELTQKIKAMVKHEYNRDVKISFHPTHLRIWTDGRD